MDYFSLSPVKQQAIQQKSLSEKMKLAQEVISQGLEQYPHSAVAFTGGKDSTLLLWLIKQVTATFPEVLFIDEGDVFPEIWQFVAELQEKWQFKMHVVHNKDVSAQVENIGDMISVKNLNPRNQSEIKKLGITETEFEYQPESYIGNHLMKTVAGNLFIEENKIDALFVGVRWDEQEARSTDAFFRKIEEPAHVRIEPILPFTEHEVWQVIQDNDIPFVSLYNKGYRSLGAKSTTQKMSDQPAWEQDLDNTTERAGRQQDKEKIMQRLRDLGYM